MNKDLPGYASTLSIGAARFREIKAAEIDLARCEHGARTFQRLPRHMQRRAVSGNPQRLPRSLRPSHMKEMKTKKKITKRPCRKYRRRGSNLLSEYHRRQRYNIWLETHIWHAKRFHMEKIWGYTIPKTPTAKCYRATLRAATESCMIQDVSYENCIECEGPLIELTKALKRVLSSEDIIALLEPEALKGLTWLSIMLYAPDKMPYGAIGNVQLIWIPEYEKAVQIRRLWVWVHPSIYEEVCEVLKKLFQLEIIFEKEQLNIETDIGVYNNVLGSKLASKNIPMKKIPKSFSRLHNDIKIFWLKDTLAKFNLVGPKSYNVLKQTIIPSTVHASNNNHSKSELGDYVQESLSTDWWKDMFLNSLHYNANNQHVSLWKTLSSEPLKSKKIISFVMRDPRLVLPLKKQTIVDEDPVFTRIMDSSHYPPSTIIFDAKVRDCVTLTMKPTHDINQMRSQHLIPGSSFALDDNESRVPVLLLHKPSSHASGLGNGWELILPCGWGAVTWINLVMNGAVASGQDQAEILRSEFLTSPLPFLLPDTQAGLSFSTVKYKEKEIEYFKRPPSCRSNFIKYGIKNPFGFDWMKLVKYWNEESTNFFVLRDKMLVKTLTSATCKKLIKMNSKKDIKVQSNNFSPDSKSFKTETSEKLVQLTIPGNALIYVRIIMMGKGKLQPFAIIYLPTSEDLKNLSLELESSGNISSCHLSEPIHEDSNIKLRADLKEKHNKNKKRLQRKRKIARMKILNGDKDPLKTYSSIEEALACAVIKVEEQEKELIEEIAAYRPTMNRLWTEPNDGKNCLQQGIRNIIGYVTNGGFCQRMGRSGGIGWVVSKPLVSLLEHLNLLKNSNDGSGTSINFPPHRTKDTELKTSEESENSDNIKTCRSMKQVYVLVRNTENCHYMWARLVVLDVLGL